MCRCRDHREGDHGQAWVGLAVPGKPISQHHDPLQVAIPLTRQQRAGPQLRSGPVEVRHQPVDPFRATPTRSGQADAGRRNPIRRADRLAADKPESETAGGGAGEGVRGRNSDSANVCCLYGARRRSS
jgi:hypothetical protein